MTTMSKLADLLFKYTVNIFKYTAIFLFSSLWILLIIVIIYHIVKFIGTLIF